MGEGKGQTAAMEEGADGQTEQPPVFTHLTHISIKTLSFLHPQHPTIQAPPMSPSASLFACAVVHTQRKHVLTVGRLSHTERAHSECERKSI